MSQSASDAWILTGPASSRALGGAEQADEGVRSRAGDIEEVEEGQRTEEAWVDSCQIRHGERSTNAVESCLDQTLARPSRTEGGRLPTGPSETKNRQKVVEEEPAQAEENGRVDEAVRSLDGSQHLFTKRLDQGVQHQQPRSGKDAMRRRSLDRKYISPCARNTAAHGGRPENSS